VELEKTIMDLYDVDILVNNKCIIEINSSYHLITLN